MSFEEFLGTTLGNVIAGVVVALAAYLLIERRLQLRRDRQRRAEVTEDILAAVRDELAYNKRVAEAMLANLPEGAITSAALEDTSWTLVSQVPVFTVLEPKTLEALLDTYLRVRTVNKQHALLFDFTYGPTAALSFLVASQSADGHESFQRLVRARDDLRARLLRRVEDLVPRLDEATRRVGEELRAADIEQLTRASARNTTQDT